MIFIPSLVFHLTNSNDEEKLSSSQINWNDLKLNQGENEDEGEGEGSIGKLDQQRIAKLFDQFQAQQKKDRLRFGKGNE